LQPLGHVRTLATYAEDGRWDGEESGEVRSFEVTDRYLGRRKRDRLDRALLVEYLSALGIRVDDAHFFGTGVVVTQNV
jgi:hypothetical protein